jgi:hypothetical protein
MAALREFLAHFAITVDTAPLKTADAAINGMRSSLGKLGAALAGAAVIGGVKSFIHELSEAGDQIIDTSAQLGLGTDEFQQWGLAAKLSGAEAGDLATSIKLLQKNMADASTAGSPAAAKFKELGISVRDAAGNMRPTGDVLAEAGIAISKLGSPAERTAAALGVFGKAGTKLLPMFADGEEGLKKLLAQFKELGGGYSEDALEQMGKLGDETDKYEFALTSLKSQIALAILPTINNMITGLSKFVASVKLSAQQTGHFQTALITLGVVGAAAGLSMAAPYILMGLMLAAIVLLVDDVVTAIRGGDSLTGRFIDKLFGKGTAKSLFAEIRKDLEELNAILRADPGRSGFENVVSRIGASLARVPGEFKLAGVTAFNNLIEALTGSQSSVTADNVGSKITEGLKSGLMSGLKGLGKVLFDEVKAALDPIGTLVQLMTELGTKIVAGLGKGMKEGATEVLDTAKTIAKGIVGVTTGIILPGSPSRVFTGLAATIPQGLAKGMLMHAPEVRMAASSMMAPVMAAGNSTRSISIENRNSFAVNVTGTGPGAVRQGIGQGLDDSNAATLAALETLA